MANPFSIDPVPILSTSILTLVDRRDIGASVPISESYQVSPSALVRLRECPEKDTPSSIVIPGYVEVLSIPSSNQFSVDYGNGIITFNAAQIGAVVTISYMGTGSVIQAADSNNITVPLQVLATTLSGGLIERAVIIATSSQTVFNVGFAISSTDTLVYSNGLLMTEGGSADYTITGSSQVTFNAGKSTGDVVNFIKIGI